MTIFPPTLGKCQRLHAAMRFNSVDDKEAARAGMKLLFSWLLWLMVFGLFFWLIVFLSDESKASLTLYLLVLPAVGAFALVVIASWCAGLRLRQISIDYWFACGLSALFQLIVMFSTMQLALGATRGRVDSFVGFLPCFGLALALLGLIQLVVALLIVTVRRHGQPLALAAMNDDRPLSAFVSAGS